MQGHSNEYGSFPSSSCLIPSSPSLSPASLRSSPELDSLQCQPLSSSSSSSSPSDSLNPRHNKRRERKEKQTESIAYGLRSQTRIRVPKTESSDTSDDAREHLRSSKLRSFPPAPDGGKEELFRAGRLQKWQLDILQHAFDNGIWSPGDVTVESLKRTLVNRTEKQIRDWFSHRRRRLRESGVTTRKGDDEGDIAKAVEALLLISRSNRR